VPSKSVKKKIDIEPSKEVKKKFNIVPYIFIFPHVILFTVFLLIPTLYGLYAAFTKWNIFDPPQWVGLANFITIFTDTKSTYYQQFWNGLKNTVLFVIITVPFQLLIPLLLSFLLSTKPKGHGFFRSVFYLPGLFSITTVIMSWLYVFNRSQGIFNRIFSKDIDWFGTQPFAWISIVVVTIWWVIGTNIVIYTAALSGVDSSMLESSEIDGANRLQRFFYIILPSIKFPLTYTLVIAVIMQFNIYGQPLLMTLGGPNQSTYVLIMYIRELAFAKMIPIGGMASAMSSILGLIIAAVSIVQIRLLRNEDTR